MSSGAATRAAPSRHRMRTDPTARVVLLASLNKRRPELWRMAAWSGLEVLPALLSGVLVARAVDDGFLAGRLGTGFGWLGLLAISVVVGAWGARQTLRRLAAVVEPFRDELVTGVVTSSLRRATMPGTPASSSADVARLTQHVEIAREAYAAVLIVVQQFLVITIGALIGLVTLAPTALLLVLPPLVVALGMFAVVLQRMAGHQRASIIADERVAETTMTMTSGLRDIAACGAAALAQGGVGRHIDEARAATTAVSRLTGLASLAVAVGSWVPLVLILALGSWLIGNGATTGVLLGAATYVLQGLQPALQTLVDGLSGPGLWLMVTMRRIVETGGAGESGQPGGSSMPHTEPLIGDEDPAARGYELCLSGVSFTYSAAAEPVLNGFDLTIGEGDHLAVVGPSGAGKSTLAGLMSGLLEPQLGRVTMDGVGLGDQSPTRLARRRVLIPQEAYVFAGTLRENLCYLGNEIDDADLDRAAQLLGAEDLVARLGGYGAEIDPVLLSAGERQLITLVRAFVASAPVVILDEATCHLDPVAEARVEHAFAARPGTLVVIAHRMSSALRAKRTLVLDGTTELLGEHEELLEHSLLYRDLVGHWNVPGNTARPS